MQSFLYKPETFKIIVHCMKVQSILGFGFSEIVYKDAMEIEFIQDRLYHEREPKLTITYKGQILKSLFSPDFTCFEKIILEVKASENGLSMNHIAQILNYLKISGYKVGLLINFGRHKLEYKRIVR